MKDKEKTKSYEIGKREVFDSYLRVKANQGSAGVDKETLDDFDKNMSGNLYKIWNRMSSGSYIAPSVKEVQIPKKLGGKRPLGIPTVSDRIAQGVIKARLEAILEPKFHRCSYGYRPGRSAHDALRSCKDNCFVYDWVIDLDIKGFFDNISHEWMMKFVEYHTTDKCSLLYIERWIKAKVEKEDGQIVDRTKGTPQGGVISPLLANLYLHHAFDLWMKKEQRNNPFERYADDIIIHCNSEEEAKALLELIRERLNKFDLELHADKTRIVYCKDDKRGGNYAKESFIFLSYSFQPRPIKRKGIPVKIVFFPAISCKAKTLIRRQIRAVFNPSWTQYTIEQFTGLLNAKIRGWVNYYGMFKREKILTVFNYLNFLIRIWLKKKYKILSAFEQIRQFRSLCDRNKELFYHWKLGVIS